MNVFILTTGRSGSVSFAIACQHISNYSVAHESRSHLIGQPHFEYPDQHIEVDNRLSWFLGSLDRIYGKDAFYVHLIRNKKDTANSFCKRYDHGIIKAYRQAILIGADSTLDPILVCKDYYTTVNDNIELFLRDKPNKMNVTIETIEKDFAEFWLRINAAGNLPKAINEWSSPRHTSSKRFAHTLKRLKGLRRLVRWPFTKKSSRRE